MPTFSGIVVATGGAPADNRRTLLEVVDELSRPVDASDTTVRALAGDAFRAAVRTMNMKGMWPWEVVDEDLTLTANQRFSSLTSAVKKPLAMHYLSAVGGVRDRRIAYLPYYRFIEIYDQNLDGEAHTYTIPNMFETAQILWFPTPTGNDNARFTFYRVTPAPRLEQESIEVPEYALETYMAVAWYEFLKRLPTEQRPFPMEIAMRDRIASFRALASHIAFPSDTSRESMVGRI